MFSTLDYWWQHTCLEAMYTTVWLYCICRFQGPTFEGTEAPLIDGCGLYHLLMLIGFTVPCRHNSVVSQTMPPCHFLRKVYSVCILRWIRVTDTNLASFSRLIARPQPACMFFFLSKASMVKHSAPTQKSSMIIYTLYKYKWIWKRACSTELGQFTRTYPRYIISNTAKKERKNY